MIEQLKKILVGGADEALKLQSESTNHSFVMKGKGDAFREVLLVIDQLENKEDGSEDSPAEKAEVKK
jgi:hypothetical protein